jgi:GT2 family glycosyltransferase
MHVAIILLNWNGKSDTLKCLESLDSLHYHSYEILVADNGSSDGSCEAILAAYPHVIWIDNQKNLGFAEGNNRAIAYALTKTFDALFILNNDTIVDPHILDALTMSSIKNPDTILGCRTYLYSQKTVLDHFGGVWNKQKAQFDLIGYRQLDEHFPYTHPIDLDYICGCALFVPTAVFKKVGFFDPRFFLFWEESDLCFRAKQLGFKLMICHEAKLWHKVSASFTGGKPHTTYFWWRNRLLWIEKNLTWKEKYFSYRHCLLPEIFKLYRHYFIKSCIYYFLKFFSVPSLAQRQEKISYYKAALCGVHHYLLRRFYEGPTWICNKKT